MNIATSRLINHRLIQDSFGSIAQTVRSLGAVQAQDFNGAAWSLSLRTRNVSRKNVVEALNTGKIVRTHILRPTWHFVAPEDLNWMLKLSSRRIQQTMNYYNRRLELDEYLFVKTHSIIANALVEKKFLTRQELSQVLLVRGIKAQGQRLSNIVMQAETDGLICSGPIRDKQFTYALTADRIRKVKDLSIDEALATLTYRYFLSHGPATLQDFCWWSGLTVKAARVGLRLSEKKLHSKNSI